MSKEQKVWRRYARNVQLDCPDFWISYNSDTSNAPAMFMGDELQETALCKDGKFFILNGDWRRQYEKIADKGFWACYQFYLLHKDEHGSSWSNEDLPVKQVKDAA